MALLALGQQQRVNLTLILLHGVGQLFLRGRTAEGMMLESEMDGALLSTILVIWPLAKPLRFSGSFRRKGEIFALSLGTFGVIAP